MTIHGISFCGKPLKPGAPPVIVAEVGFNHNGDVRLAKEMIQAAAEHGADAVKLQIFTGSELVNKKQSGPDPDHPGQLIPTYQFFQRYELQARGYAELMDYARGLKIPLFAAPFDEGALELMMSLQMPAVKIASGDLTHLPLLRAAARKKLPVVLSTGMGDLGDIEAAVNAIRGQENGQIILLHCVSNYPAKHDEMNLRCITTLQAAFGLPVGLSDHTLDSVAAIAATALGAVMIEKHFTLDRKMPGVDQGISIEPRDLRELKTATANTALALGNGRKEIGAAEGKVKQIARRSLTAKRDISSGEIITADMLACKRPGTGIPPACLEQVAGRAARVDIPAEQVITWDMV